MVTLSVMVEKKQHLLLKSWDDTYDWPFLCHRYKCKFLWNAPTFQLGPEVWKKRVFRPSLTAVIICVPHSLNWTPLHATAAEVHKDKTSDLIIVSSFYLLGVHIKPSVHWSCRSQSPSPWLPKSKTNLLHLVVDSGKLTKRRSIMSSSS